jgi:hypothetical protein
MNWIRKHHQELHRHGNEANWSANLQIAPIPKARELWKRNSRAALGRENEISRI